MEDEKRKNEKMAPNSRISGLRNVADDEEVVIVKIIYRTDVQDSGSNQPGPSGLLSSPDRVSENKPEKTATSPGKIKDRWSILWKSQDGKRTGEKVAGLGLSTDESATCESSSNAFRSVAEFPSQASEMETDDQCVNIANYQGTECHDEENSPEMPSLCNESIPYDPSNSSQQQETIPSLVMAGTGGLTAGCSSGMETESNDCPLDLRKNPQKASYILQRPNTTPVDADEGLVVTKWPQVAHVEFEAAEVWSDEYCYPSEVAGNSETGHSLLCEPCTTPQPQVATVCDVAVFSDSNSSEDFRVVRAQCASALDMVVADCRSNDEVGTPRGSVSVPEVATISDSSSSDWTMSTSGELVEIPAEEPLPVHVLDFKSFIESRIETHFHSKLAKPGLNPKVRIIILDFKELFEKLQKRKKSNF